MAEYIDRERVIQEIKDMDNCGCITRSVNHVCENMRGIPTADVVERSEYIELLKENERLRGDLEFKSEALNSIGQIHKEYVSKIDKAISEIENEEIEVDYMDERKSGFNSGIFRALEILRKNTKE